MTLPSDGAAETANMIEDQQKTARRQPNLKFYDAVVLEIKDESPTVKLFELEIPGVEEFKFKAGQFVQLDLPIQSEITRRSYSISSRPDGGNKFQLCVVRYPGGAGSAYLFDEVNPGSVLKASQPLGRFTLPDPVTEEVCFICTGVGVAPFRAILKDIFTRRVVHKDIHLFFGNRRQEDILYRAEWERMHEEHPEFHYYPILSREQAPEWGGLTGYVHPHYLDLFKDARPAKFYLCGWTAMLHEARTNLEALGYTHHDIKIELYT